jgi:hypothetical protein
MAQKTSQKPARDAAVSTYDFRYHAEGECGVTKEGVYAMVRGVAKHYVFQLERSDGGYLHWQGRMSLLKRRRKPELVAAWASMTTAPLPPYLAPTSKEDSATDLYACYAAKADTRVEGPYSDRNEPKKVPRQWQGLLEKLYPWQKAVWDSADVFEPRSVNVVVCPEGSSGKSTIAHLCRLHKNAIVCPPINDDKELVQAVLCMCKARESDPPLVFIDMPRASNQEKMFNIFNAIEQIKNGYLLDVRYQCREHDIDSPQVWVFCNTAPKAKYLSKDRWRWWTISPDKALVRISMSDDEIMSEPMRIDDEDGAPSKRPRSEKV